MLEFEESNEIECALNALWSLFSKRDNIGSNTKMELSRILPKLKRKTDENIKAGAIRLEVKIAALKDGAERHKTNEQCDYAERCRRFWQSLGIEELYTDKKYHSCYCATCHGKRADRAYASKGAPPKSYGVPVGWYRIGLSVPAQAEGNKAFEKWHRAFHGTVLEHLHPILKVGGLVPPGRNVLGKKRIDVRPGHFCEKWKPDNFNIHQVFLSPSIRYAGIDAYAQPSRYAEGARKSYQAKVAFQVLIAPDSYKVGPQTVGARSQIDPGFDNRELEWSTDEHGATILYGILIKLTDRS